MSLPQLWEIVNWMSENASKIIGVDNDSIPLNIGYGALGAIATANILSKAVIKYTPYKYQEYLPEIFTGLEKITLAAPIVYALVEPDIKQITQNHPVYTWGTASGILTASQVFNQYSNKTKESQNKLI